MPSVPLGKLEIERVLYKRGKIWDNFIDKKLRKVHLHIYAIVIFLD